MGWDGWDGNARTTSGWPGQQQTWLGQLLSPPPAAGGLGKGEAAAGRSGSAPELLLHPSRLPKLGEKSCKKTLFCPWLGFSALITAQERWGFPAEGLDAAPRSQGWFLSRWELRLGWREAPKRLWNLQNRFHHLKIKDFSRSSSRTPQCCGLPIPLPKASFPSRVFGVSVGFLVQPFSAV